MSDAVDEALPAAPAEQQSNVVPHRASRRICNSAYLGKRRRTRIQPATITPQPRCRTATEKARGESKNKEARSYRFRRMSLATFPLGPNGFWGLPFSSALTPPAFPSVNMN